MIAYIRKCTILLVALILFFSMGNVAFATSEDSKAPELVMGTQGVQWVNTNSVDVDLSFRGTKAFCGASVIGNPGTTRITGKVVLARKNVNGTYTTVKKWSGLETTGNKLLFDKTYNIAADYTYRLTITATVYRNGTSEKVTKYAEDYAS